MRSKHKSGLYIFLIGAFKKKILKKQFSRTKYFWDTYLHSKVFFFENESVHNLPIWENLY